MKRIGTISVLQALLFSLACYAQTPEKKDDNHLAWSDPTGLELKLELIKKDLNDWNQNQLKLTVTNTGKKDIEIDKDLIVGISLRCERNPTDYIFNESRDVSLKEVKKLSKPKPEDAARRFVTLPPGKSLTRTFDLSQPITIAHSGHATHGGAGGIRYHVGFFYESQDRYQFPKDGKRFEFSIWYEGSIWFSAYREFEKWFGVSLEKVQPSPVRARSNVIVIVRK